MCSCGHNKASHTTSTGELPPLELELKLEEIEAQ